MLCERPDVLSRWMLEETAALLPSDARSALVEITCGTPFPKPADHRGGSDTDMFDVALPPGVVHSIVEAVDDAVRQGRRTPRSTRIGGFATAWRELSDWQGRHV